jgi:hypothetical protein
VRVSQSGEASSAPTVSMMFAHWPGVLLASSAICV